MPEVSVVIPCLNEEETIAACITKARDSFAGAGIDGEIVIVDNGSTDRSPEIARNLGARVISETQKGYGNALRRGIEEAKGRYIVMGDGDDTYDFSQAHKFVAALKQGYDLAMGSRFKGKILPGAMTWSHRYIGNPILSGILRLFFGGNISDSHCGLRAFTKEAYVKMGLHAAGMEFASEMVIHSLKKKLRITEIPIVYYARRGESKLDSFRDAWRHMRFMLLYSPVYLYFVPALVLFVPSVILLVKFLFGPVWLFGHPWDIRSMVFASITALLGWQIMNLGFCAVAYADSIGLMESPFVTRFVKSLSLERMLVSGLVIFLIGLFSLGGIFFIWAQKGFGELHIYEIDTIKLAIFSLTFLNIGIQLVFTAFLSSMFQIKFRN